MRGRSTVWGWGGLGKPKAAAGRASGPGRALPVQTAGRRSSRPRPAPPVGSRAVRPAVRPGTAPGSAGRWPCCSWSGQESCSAPPSPRSAPSSSPPPTRCRPLALLYCRSRHFHPVQCYYPLQEGERHQAVTAGHTEFLLAGLRRAGLTPAVASDSEILRVCRVLDCNSFEVGGEGGECRAVYPLAAMLNHRYQPWFRFLMCTMYLVCG